MDEDTRVALARSLGEVEAHVNALIAEQGGEWRAGQAEIVVDWLRRIEAEYGIDLVEPLIEEMQARRTVH